MCSQVHAFVLTSLISEEGEDSFIIFEGEVDCALLAEARVLVE